MPPVLNHKDQEYVQDLGLENALFVAFGSDRHEAGQTCFVTLGLNLMSNKRGGVWGGAQL